MSQTSYAPNPVPRLRTKPPPVSNLLKAEEDTHAALLAYYSKMHVPSEDEEITLSTLTFPLARRIAQRLHTLLHIESLAIFNCGYLAGVRAAQQLRR